MIKAKSAQTNCDIVETAVIRKRVQKVFNAQLTVMLYNMSWTKIKSQLHAEIGDRQNTIT